ncbi:NAD(P)-binding protein [Aspergillus homomorphus CBS 101889]|uniref:NAD(P)-binding protein n=1 Tax=Aspergillus homomorphus (strain CBS 101889) TaxID=1450537 RepID=A0A395HVH2_ASPHC|nr:NAD(P)-binding protein [Aspergillus homomorphus CBS 101889]RAL11516.1 NAD(P)-binding protein [Aspergillus homomorphus CBS 101889]
MKFETVAIFGATGQIGQLIVQAFQKCKKQNFKLIQVVQPGHDEEARRNPGVDAKFIDITSASKEEIATALQGVDVVVSALGGKGMEMQPLIQDAADVAGVKRFYPSEYGMHHIYRKPGDDWGYLHPIWDMKEVSNEKCLHHPAVKEGRMSYTLIGCGDFYDQDREPTWCPWTQTDVDKYTLRIVGDANARCDFTNRHDLAAYLVESCCHPERSENATLNFVSDHISYNEIASLLEKYAKRPVEKVFISEEDMHAYIADPSSAPAALREGSPFPLDFWMMVKGAQGQGRFWRPPGQVHNNLFPDVEVTPFEAYFQRRFA